MLPNNTTNIWREPLNERNIFAEMLEEFFSSPVESQIIDINTSYKNEQAGGVMGQKETIEIGVVELNLPDCLEKRPSMGRSIEEIPGEKRKEDRSPASELKKKIREYHPSLRLKESANRSRGMM